MLLKVFEKFDWRIAPLRGIEYPIIFVGLYFVVIYTIQDLVEQRRLSHIAKHKLSPAAAALLDVKTYSFDKQVRLPFAFHNFVLAGMSFIMFILGIVGVYERSIGASERGSFSWLLCEKQTVATGSLYFVSYLYYLSKYYELIDTVFLALKGKLKGWGGLNVYHHSVVVFMSWWWLEYVQSLQFLGLLFNVFVHIIMYTYYGLGCLGMKPKWGATLTFTQIVQFLTSLVLFCMTMKRIFLDGEHCEGFKTLMVNLVFNVTLLFEFIDIFDKKKADQDKEKHR